MSNIGRIVLYSLLILLAVAVLVGAVALLVHLLGITAPPDDTSDTDTKDTFSPPESSDDSTKDTEQSGTDTEDTTGSSDTDDTTGEDTSDPEADDGVLVTEYDEPIIMYALYNVNARMKDTTDSDIMGMVYQGDAITVTGETSNKWYRVDYRGYTAYIRSDLLTPDSSVANVEIELYTSPKTMYAISNVNVRESHSTNSKKLETIVTGTEVKVTGHTENGWYRIEYGETYAYINDEYLSETKSAETEAPAA